MRIKPEGNHLLDFWKGCLDGVVVVEGVTREDKSECFEKTCLFSDKNGSN